MKKLLPSDIGLMEGLLDFTQPELQMALFKILKKYYKDISVTKEYLVGWGDIPVALVAHLDTVFPDTFEKEELYYDQRKGVMWKPHGAGFDDRAGVFAIIKILQAGYRPTVIFTTDEEIGGGGAHALVSDMLEPKADVKYLIELDRQGYDDCVFYSCGNDEFISYVESFGFCEQWGTFSDISIICPEWKIAGVNLSIGYFDEHTPSETLRISSMLATISKVKEMLEAANDAPYFNYIYRRYNFKEYYWKKYGINIVDDTSMEVICTGCGKAVSEWDSIPVMTVDGGTRYYCGDCLPVADIDFCPVCGEAFEVKDENDVLCPKCRLGKKC